MRSRAVGLGVILFLTSLAYLNIFPNQFVMDDFDFIVDWPLIQDWKNLPKFFIGYVTPDRQEGIYSPLKTLFHAITYHFFGLNPAGYHAVSILVHAAAVIYIYRLTRALTQNLFVAFLTALFFGLHPIHTDVIASMTGTIDVVGIVFLLISFYNYVLYRQGSDRPRRLYLYSLLFAFAAVFTHELCLALPILFLWYDLSLSEGRGDYKGAWKRIGPFFVTALFYVLCKFLVLGSIARGRYLYDSFYLTMLVIIKAWAQYVYLCFFPVTLTHNRVISPGIFSFDQEDFDKAAVLSQSLLEPQVLISLVLWGGIFYAAWKNRLRKPLVTFSIGWFFLSLAPVSNIVPTGVYSGERYLYHGLWGFCLLLALFLDELRNGGWFFKRKYPVLAGVIVAALVIFYSARMWRRAGDLRNEVTLFESAVRANPYSALLRTDLGIIYTRNRMPEKAVASFQKALSIRPDEPVVYFSMAEAYVRMRQEKEAADALRSALALKEEYPEAHFNLAGLYARQGSVDKAKAHLDKALSYYRLQGREEEAREVAEAFKNYFGF